MVKRVYELEQELEHRKTEETLAVERAIAMEKETSSRARSEMVKRVYELEQELEHRKTEEALAVERATAAGQEEIGKLKLALQRETDAKQGLEESRKTLIERAEHERAELERDLKERHREALQQKEAEIKQLRDYRAHLSTKMLGETLERHCEVAFNQIRATAFPNAYFEKDNDARTGSKGDYIYRESAGGIEFISIMFEMKNEMETTATKKKNEDFFKELDKDRREKKCEYAVLVSMLETDNELYNTGIYSVYQYEKMYVIRPQFFIPLITLLRNSAMNSLSYRRQLEEARQNNVDLEQFEISMEHFKSGFLRNFDLASRQFDTAIAEIDATIKKLERVRQELTSSQRNLRLANDKAQELSIKRLTKNSPGLRAQFATLDAARMARATVEEADAPTLLDAKENE